MKLNKFFNAMMAVAVLALAFTACNKENGADSIKLKLNKMTLSIGQEYQIPVDNASGTITWTSSDEAIVTVNAEGVAKGIAAGEAEITATVGKASAKVAVLVEDGGGEEDNAPDLDKPEDGKLQVVIEIPEGTECHGIALKGTFDGETWSGENTYLGEEGAATPVDGAIYKFEAIPDYANWYTVTIDATEALQFKVCLIYAGDGSWQGQATGVEDHECGFTTVDNSKMSGEGQCQELGANGGLLYLKIGGWNKSECVVEELEARFITVTVPECGAEAPVVVGSFCDWKVENAVAMELVEGKPNTYYARILAYASDEFKFAGAESGWGNEIQEHIVNVAEDVDKWEGLGNIKCGNQNDFEFDYSDAEKYQWTKCGAEEGGEEGGEN